MSRVRADDYDEKKRLILERAAYLFARKGFGSATMIDIAQACGASKSRLYHYFTSKEEVLFAIAMRYVESMYETLTEAIAEPLPASARFARFVAAFVEQGVSSRSEQLVLLNDVNFLPEDKRQEVRAMENRLVGLLVGLLEEVNPGLMKPAQVRVPYAMLLFGMVIWTFTWYERDGTVSPEELAARISQLFLRGFEGTEWH
ncbi:TetR/AcrR family transcriptional regulator [Pseudomonas sp. NBRC 100443]|uniref:TetR/AcrR family transcriptional regulator n=1 Tax=Pseudomonas sp. NBRC 100443 TaxID=1113665 RepID=UPI0024A2D973|nr:TetR/AcrR family transcriptional regulator [Pseudomonas sp. NBRC 100443]GLU39231.1 TetR family transcriptional regulator [Pseudomonas sp. NBRC 100443]